MFNLVDGSPFAFEQLRGRWDLCGGYGGAYGSGCEAKLWKIRQVRQAQGKDLGRIERVWLIDDDQAPQKRFESDYAGTWFVRSGANAVVSALPAAHSTHDHIYLIDPQGNIMLRFPPAADAKLMIKDIGRLLKYSSTG